MTDGTAYSLFVYDTRYRTWHREDAAQAVGFAWWSGGLHMLAADGDGGTELAFCDIPQNYTESGTIVFRREVPALTRVCVNENRLWGTDGKTIYASKLGDPFNFHVFDGLSTDSWQSGAVDAGEFTACVSYLGYPVFFKEDQVCKVYGDKPSNFQWTPSARLGVKAGCAKGPSFWC